MKIVCFCLCIALLSSCEALDKVHGTGELRISFAGLPGDGTRGMTEIPDTGDFIITVADSKGRGVYDGKFSACPEVLEVPSGSYVVKAVSRAFSVPEFSAPQFGDEQCVVVSPSGISEVRLSCTQMNAGVKLDIDRNFPTAFPDGVLFLKSSGGKLMYGYSEKRVAYFAPGSISLVLSAGGKDEVLMTRTLVSQDMLTLKVRIPTASAEASGPAVRLSVEVDTTRNWLNDSVTLGQGSNDGSTESMAMTVAQARDSAGDEDVWVCGYIVGGDLSSTSASFAPPFKSRTSLLLGPKSSTSIRQSCMSVQLPAGELRESLNLADNPSLLGRKIYIRGNIVESYYGLPGIKNVSEYEFD